jgi:hypothetical protein
MHALETPPFSQDMHALETSPLQLGQVGWHSCQSFPDIVAAPYVPNEHAGTHTPSKSASGVPGMLAHAVHSADAVHRLQPQSVGVVPKQNLHI